MLLGTSLRLSDRFWWDLHAPDPTPEDFAAELCADVGAHPSHATAVAAALRMEVGRAAGWVGG